MRGKHRRSRHVIDPVDRGELGLPDLTQNDCLKVARKKTAPAFEEAMKELESLVESLEQGDQSLEASLQAFERGVSLTRICQQALDEAEQKVRVLAGETPEAELEPFGDDHE
jgi:exodeoxyribonuclease VII small subunit